MGAAKSNRVPRFRHPSKIPAPIQSRIETERRRLQKASAVLAALVYAANHEATDLDSGDIASVARQLIDQAVIALDSVSLKRT